MRVSESCYAVTGLGYSTPWCVNAGFVVGRHTTLIIDTGANALAAASIYGYAKAVRATNELRVVNTEKHFDHIGGNSLFRNEGIEIWGHSKLKRTAEEFAREMVEFNDGIGNAVRRERNESLAFFADTTLALPDRAIDSEMRFDLGSVEAEIVPTPGHTETNLSVWISQERVLFCGDCLINGYLPNMEAGGPRDWETWLRSLDRVETLDPLVIVAGHGPVIKDRDVGRVLAELRKIIGEAVECGHSPTTVTR